MDKDSQKKLARIVRESRVASLGVLHNGHPFISMVLFVPAPDFAVFYIHASRLATHTRCFLEDPHVGMMLMEEDCGAGDPQQLARISIEAMIEEMSPVADDYNLARSSYLQKFPQSAQLLSFGDFGFYRIVPESIRYVAGFAKAFNLTPEALRHASQEEVEEDINDSPE